MVGLEGMWEFGTNLASKDEDTGDNTVVGGSKNTHGAEEVFSRALESV